MKLLSIQPFSLFKNGGGSRILRRLYEGYEEQVISLIVEENIISPPNPGNISEDIIVAQPLVKKWVRWRLRDWFAWLRENPFRTFTIKQIRKKAAIIPFDVVHIVNYGSFSSALSDEGFRKDKPLWVSFHDHFTTTNMSSAKNSSAMTEALWNKADRRLVISSELGHEYQRLFGDKTFEIITDGVSQEEISTPNTELPSTIIIYFAGLLHIEYLPLFKVLADALDTLSNEGYKFKLVLRATQTVNFLKNRSFETEYRREFLIDIKKELDSATILYLPIKFSTPNFYLYSLSTKMVGYLGGAGTILFHGPSDSAACKLLRRANAAYCCTTLVVSDLASSIREILLHKNEVSYNAKILAKRDFNLNTIQKKFWQIK